MMGAELKDPENISSAMLQQGVLTIHLSSKAFGRATYENRFFNLVVCFFCGSIFRFRIDACFSKAFFPP